MIPSYMIYEASGFDPYENLATEQYLLEHLLPGQCILYLWQNQNTVVIGRNQNAWTECRTSLLQQEHGKLARRLSGGGAVFHDLGNLNFTFFMNETDYDTDKQLSVIQKACAMAGICTEKSGRNDLLAQGRKFSGNAFYHSQGRAYHHGTILIHSDMDKLQRYLSPSKAKLASKGIRSVRSRVVNLSELANGLTIDTMKAYMRQAFEEVYQANAQSLCLSNSAVFEIKQIRERISSWGYLYGNPLPFTCQLQQQFSWGNLEINIQAKSGIIQAVKVYSDAMDWSLPSSIENALPGCRFTAADVQNKLSSVISDPIIKDDIYRMIESQQL